MCLVLMYYAEVSLRKVNKCMVGEGPFTQSVNDCHSVKLDSNQYILTEKIIGVFT